MLRGPALPRRSGTLKIPTDSFKRHSELNNNNSNTISTNHHHHHNHQQQPVSHQPHVVAEDTPVHWSRLARLRGAGDGVVEGRFALLHALFPEGGKACVRVVRHGTAVRGVVVVAL